MADTNTIVGESILIKGNLEGDEDLTVQGRIEGSINLTKTLIIEPRGVVKAEVSVANAIVSGVMVGNLTATDSVELTETGRMVGDLRSPRVIITEGAAFKGQVDMGDMQLPRQTTGGRPLARPTMTARQATKPMPAPARPAAKASASAPVRAAAVAAPADRKPAVSVATGSKKKVVVKKKR